IRLVAILARGLVASSQAIGVMATIFPPNSSLSGEPFALQEYYASCYANGSLSLITLPISRHTRNIMHSPSHSASITVGSSPPTASRARVSLMGTVTFLDSRFAVEEGIRDCYLERHPDARWWLPDDPDAAHMASWARFDPHSIFFVGGFGDKHYIGDVPLELYQDARPSEFLTVAGRVKVQTA
ncbi:pyridoxamine 5'-phosphate oxidase-domain-containing protein, partial [Phellopilus nigrolimitatus]